MGFIRSHKLLIIGLLYALIYCVFTFPSVLNPVHSLIGKNDAYMFLWNSYGLHQAFGTGTPWHTQEMLYPWGAPLLGKAYIPPVSLLFAILPQHQLLLYNIAFLVMFVLSGIGAYLLARHFIQNHFYAFICGFVFAFSPFKMARLEEHYTFVFTGLMPFLILLYIKTFEPMRFLPQFWKVPAKRLIGLSLLAVGVIASDFFVFIQAGYFFCFIIIYQFLSPLVTKRPILWGIGAALFFVAMHFTVTALIAAGVSDNAALWFSGHWSDFVIPYNSAFYTFLGNNAPAGSKTIESAMFLGYSLLVLLAVAVAVSFRKQLSDQVKMLGFVVIMLMMIVMPVFLVGPIKLYPPTAVLHFLPVFTSFRCPTRFVNLLFLILPIVSLMLIEKNATSKYVRYGIVGSLFLFMIIEYAPSTYARMSDRNIPEIYRDLGNEQGRAVLTYPFGLRDGFREEGHFDERQAFYQIWHMKPMVGGYFSRTDGWMWDVHHNNPLAQALFDLHKDPQFSPAPMDARKAMSELKIDIILIDSAYQHERGAQFLDSIAQRISMQKHSANGGHYYLIK